METLYEWLLHNTENAGNYYTILNTHRDGPDHLEVMARSKEFRIVNLFIQNGQPNSLAENEPLPHEALKERYIFNNEQQIITYLAEGKTPDLPTSADTAGIQVFVAEPEDEAGDLAFPPRQT